MKFIQQLILLLFCLYGARDCSIKYLNKSDAENPKEISTTHIYQNNNLLNLPKYFLLKNAFIDVSLTGQVMAKNGGKEYQVNMLIPVYDKQYSPDSLKIIKTKLFIKLKDVGKISELSTYKVMSEIIDEKEMAFFRGMSLNLALMRLNALTDATGPIVQALDYLQKPEDILPIILQNGMERSGRLLAME